MVHGESHHTIREKVMAALTYVSDLWQPISTEPRANMFRLVTSDPADSGDAELVTLTADGRHFNGEVVLEDMGFHPTHWHPIPVA